VIFVDEQFAIMSWLVISLLYNAASTSEVTGHQMRYGRITVKGELREV